MGDACVFGTSLDAHRATDCPAVVAWRAWGVLAKQRSWRRCAG